jgi:putative endonuclease
MSSDPRHQLGTAAEQTATDFLVKNGYQILERNVSYKVGEIDIVARDSDTLVFIEVRSRSRPGQVHPAATVTRRKQVQIVRAAMAYCQDHHIKDTMIRFDVIAVLGNQGKIEHIPNAFEAGR